MRPICKCIYIHLTCDTYIYALINIQTYIQNGLSECCIRASKNQHRARKNGYFQKFKNMNNI